MNFLHIAEESDNSNYGLYYSEKESDSEEMPYLLTDSSATESETDDSMPELEDSDSDSEYMSTSPSERGHKFYPNSEKEESSDEDSMPDLRRSVTPIDTDNESECDNNYESPSHYHSLYGSATHSPPDSPTIGPSVYKKDDDRERKSDSDNRETPSHYHSHSHSPSLSLPLLHLLSKKVETIENLKNG